jgi:hypothetical protein
MDQTGTGFISAAASLQISQRLPSVTIVARVP